jgi:hypothetical protein
MFFMSSYLQLPRQKKTDATCRRSILVEEAKDFATDVLPPGLLMVHDPSRCCEHDVTKLQVISGERLVILPPQMTVHTFMTEM